MWDTPQSNAGMTNEVYMEDIFIGKQINGYPNYIIFEDGRVLNTKRGRFLKPIVQANGYTHVELFNKYGSKQFAVHRLVACAFIENPNHYPVVNHKDENHSNNHVSNLEWCTHKYNMNYGTCIQRRVAHTDYKSEKRKQSCRENGKKRGKIVCQYSKDGILISRFNSTLDAFRKTGINPSHIGECCRGKRYKTVGGYIWKFERSVDLLAKQ